MAKIAVVKRYRGPRNEHVYIVSRELFKDFARASGYQFVEEIEQPDGELADIFEKQGD